MTNSELVNFDANLQVNSGLGNVLQVGREHASELASSVPRGCGLGRRAISGCAPIHSPLDPAFSPPPVPCGSLRQASLNQFTS